MTKQPLKARLDNLRDRIFNPVSLNVYGPELGVHHTSHEPTIRHTVLRVGRCEVPEKAQRGLFIDRFEAPGKREAFSIVADLGSQGCYVQLANHQDKKWVNFTT